MPSRPDSGHGYPTLLLEGASEAVDAILGELFEAGCLGMEALEGATRQRAYFPPGTAMEALRDKLAREFPELRIGPIELVPDRDWVALSRKNMSGFSLGERFFVCPSWQSPPPADVTDRIVLRIDPEQAFGTGRHDTTRLCVELIEVIAGPEVATIDVGTGTGILAMVAAALGCRPVVALDVDPDAVACARKNAERNRLHELIEVGCTDLEKAAPPPARLVVANLSLPVLEQHVSTLSEWLAPEGHMILSGITIDDVEGLTSKLEELPSPMKLVRYHTAGDWAALLASFPHGAEH